MIKFKIKQITSLEKVYLDSDNQFNEIRNGRALKNERFSYQLAYISDKKFFADVSIESELRSYITVRYVGNVPSELPCYNDFDEDNERTAPGLFPDVLFPVENDRLLIKPNNWYSLWITVDIPREAGAGDYEIKISLSNAQQEFDCSKRLTLEIIDAVLPEQKLIYTQWFHTDCIANYYNVPVFSDRHWELIDSFMQVAARTGINMLLTPIFTPPLDTAVGGERLTVQLVDVEVNNKEYSFNFDKLRKWIHMAEKNGIKYFEISHLFSQWGAVASPKIIAEVNGEKRRIFGWETDASGKEYSDFLHEFLPELIKVIKDENIENQTYFHISDEPSTEQTESYGKAKNVVSGLLKDFPIIDALSEYEFYENGLIDRPIPCTNKAEEFIEKGVAHPWTYYCCGQGYKLSNRFFSMPLARTRIIGAQFYKYSIEGFLQWGYNFYNSQHSVRAIDPYAVTDGDAAFPSGDSFSVYPYKNGAIESIRSVVFYEGLQDMRAMELLGEKIGKEKLLKKIEKKFGSITFTEYPRGEKNILELRNEINNLIIKNI